MGSAATSDKAKSSDGPVMQLGVKSASSAGPCSQPGHASEVIILLWTIAVLVAGQALILEQQVTHNKNCIEDDTSRINKKGRINLRKKKILYNATNESNRHTRASGTSDYRINDRNEDSKFRNERLRKLLLNEFSDPNSQPSTMIENCSALLNSAEMTSELNQQLAVFTRRKLELSS